MTVPNDKTYLEYWKIHWQIVADQNERIDQWLTKILNTAILLNGGAAVALVGYLGAAKNSETALIGAKSAIVALIVFGLGLLLATAGQRFAYAVCISIGIDITSKDKIDEWPFVKDTDASIAAQRKTTCNLRLARFCFTASILAFAGALFVLMQSVVRT